MELVGGIRPIHGFFNPIHGFSNHGPMSIRPHTSVSVISRGHAIFRPILLAAAMGVLVASCGDSPAGPDPADDVRFASTLVTLDGLGQGVAVVRNRGSGAVGPIHLEGGEIRSTSGTVIPGVGLRFDPPSIPTLAGGTDREISLHLDPGDALGPGVYTSIVRARNGSGTLLATLDVSLERACSLEYTPAHALEPVDAPSTLRQGEVSRVRIEAFDSEGAPLESPCLTWSLEGPGAGLVMEDGAFVAYDPGPHTLVVESGATRLDLEFSVEPRGVGGGDFTEVGAGRWTEQYTSDLWLHGDVAYTGSWGARASPVGTRFGNALHAWDISDPTAPRRTHTVEVDARTVNDVKIRDDGTLAVMTHENSNDGLNGVTILDLSDPFEPTPITRFKEGLEAGIHNVWIEGDYLYLVVNGIGNGLRVLDISDPADPILVSAFYGGESFLHDVYVRDGLAFLSHWNAGLIILDVGNGIMGGSPANPVEVGRTTTTGGRTHNAWYWPETGYVFVGEENFSRPGVMHVIDARDLTNPREVATYAVPDHTPHNFWLDEDRGILYLAWYGRGLRALDVTGELLGELERQGREVATAIYEAPASTASCHGAVDVTCTWAPQLHRGHIFVSDMNSGLRVLRPEF